MDEKMLTTTVITLITILERLLTYGTLTTALTAIFKKGFICPRGLLSF